MKILTSVVGSYPPFDAAGKPITLEQAIQAQLDKGIEVVTDGQLSGNMIDIFASKICGITPKVIGGRTIYEVAGLLAWPHTGIIVGDQMCARSYLWQKRAETVTLKGVVTGPYTLARGCMNKYYKSEKEVAMEFASVLNSELRLLENEVDVLQIDEPFFSGGLPEYLQPMFETLVHGVKKEIILHTHSRNIKKASERNLQRQDLQSVAQLPAQVIGYDCAVNQGLVILLAETNFSQRVSLGCVRTDIDFLPGIHTVAGRINRAVRALGEGKIAYVTPDCGLRLKQPRIAGEMMHRVVAARDLYYQ